MNESGPTLKTVCIYAIGVAAFPIVIIIIMVLFALTGVCTFP